MALLFLFQAYSELLAIFGTYPQTIKNSWYDLNMDPADVGREA